MRWQRQSRLANLRSEMALHDNKSYRRGPRAKSLKCGLKWPSHDWGCVLKAVSEAMAVGKEPIYASLQLDGFIFGLLMLRVVQPLLQNWQNVFDDGPPNA